MSNQNHKFCVHCLHYQADPRDGHKSARCKAHILSTVNLVSGQQEARLSYCEIERSTEFAPGFCHSTGVNFQSKETL